MENIYIISNLRTGIGPSEQTLIRKIAAATRLKLTEILEARIVKKSVDARKKPLLFHILQVEFKTKAPFKTLPANVRRLEHSTLDVPKPPFLTAPSTKLRPMDPVVIVGSGPAGLFAALALSGAGVTTVLLERGKPVEERLKDIGRLRTQGILDPESNICFGEGGAGTYTDGKLYTRIKHPYARWVLQTFINFGASPSILIDAHPHLGTENLVAIVKRMREKLIANGTQIRFQTRMENLLLRNGHVCGVRLASGEEISASAVVLAIGHSARDTFEKLRADGIHMEAKEFAVGFRAEHPQELINASQYGHSPDAAKLGAAAYQLTYNAEDPRMKSRGVYSFCMCPGGFIVPSPTETGRMAINGMSNSNRSTPFANSGVVAQVTPADLEQAGYEASPLMGMDFQRSLETAAFNAVQNPYAAPAMRISEFLSGKSSGTLAPTNFRPKAEPADLRPLIPAWLLAPLREGIFRFGRKIRGYVSSEANLMAIESRTSSPVRILRDKNGMSVKAQGLYPAGEGAGYAGGIVSAAVDGLKAAESILNTLR